MDGNELIDGARALIKQAVASGYHERDSIIAQVGDYFDGEGGDAAAAGFNIAAEVDAAIAAQLHSERGWPVTTDCDRLDAAFSDLHAIGIVARQNFTCCQTCGFAEIGDEFDAVQAEGRTVRGFVFFHQQDSERAVEGHGLFLSYGALEPNGEVASETDTKAMVGDVMSVLRRHGLSPRWESDLNQRIQLQIDWKRRFPGHLPPPPRDWWSWLRLRRPT